MRVRSGGGLAAPKCAVKTDTHTNRYTRTHTDSSIFPCQDAPAVKMTYAAKIRAPSWATVLMSALR